MTRRGSPFWARFAISSNTYLIRILRLSPFPRSNALSFIGGGVGSMVVDLSMSF
jgi:hypothetical protein